jgi:hypothetical protein
VMRTRSASFASKSGEFFCGLFSLL